MTEIRKPTIAMVNGAAVGRGMDMSLRCDIRIGCENTRFFTYQNVGQIIENGGMYYLPKLIGLGNALEFLYTGGFLWGEQAYRLGLLNHYVAAGKLEEETRALCQKIVNSPPMMHRPEPSVWYHRTLVGPWWGRAPTCSRRCLLLLQARRGLAPTQGYSPRQA